MFPNYLYFDSIFPEARFVIADIYLRYIMLTKECYKSHFIFTIFIICLLLNLVMNISERTIHIPISIFFSINALKNIIRNLIYPVAETVQHGS